jgi:FSR family fosmidomycin resistance protein-like MFS transporter
MTPVLWLFMRLSGLAQLLLLVGMGVAIGATYPGSIVMALESWPHQVGMASGLLMGLGWWPGGIGASLTGFIADRFSLTVGLQTLLFPPLIGLACILAYAALQRSRRITLPSTLEP